MQRSTKLVVNHRTNESCMYRSLRNGRQNVSSLLFKQKGVYTHTHKFEERKRFETANLYRPVHVIVLTLN